MKRPLWLFLFCIGLPFTGMTQLIPAMQLDLQEPLHIYSVQDTGGRNLHFTQEANVWDVATLPQTISR
ncbi:MAG TPA: hypothetical protein VGM31_17135 [Puia sp.]